jgi:hypothetical protein
MDEKIRERFRDYFDYADEVVRECSSIEEKTFEPERRNAILLYHYAKAINLLHAVLNLCLKGFAREAIVVSRSLFNLFINLKWLTSGYSPSRFEWFADFEIVAKKNQLDTLFVHREIPVEEWKKLRKEIEEELDYFKTKYGYVKDNETRLNKLKKWSPQISEMMKSLCEVKRTEEGTGGMCFLREYALTYQRLSQTEHTDPYSVHEYLSGAEGEGVTVKLGASEDYIPTVMADSIRYLLNVRQICSEELEICYRTHLHGSQFANGKSDGNPIAFIEKVI